MIYLDSSALIKLLVEEPESSALEGWLSTRRSVPRTSSELARIEVVRAVRRLDLRLVAGARVLLAELDLVPISSAIVERAAELGDPALRSLDAIHLASALAIRTGLTDVIAYDHRLVAAAEAAGLEVTRPGVTSSA